MFAEGILFICAANSPRSQMAEALARRVLGRDALVVSSGQRPVDPYALEVLREVDIDLSDLSSVPANETDLEGVGLVITLSTDGEDRESVPPSSRAVPRTLNWAVPGIEPRSAESREETLARFRSARDRIRGMMELLVCDELGAAEFHRA